jgi:DNA-binding CsgD family transcriptional regulator
MPEVEKQEVEKKDEKMVPLDTSGPGAEVDLPDDTVKSEEAPKEAEKTEQKEEPIKVEEVKTEEAPAKEEPVKEETKQDTLEEYSEGVKKRISKLTRKMREAERREKAALDYAAGAKREIEITRDQFQANEEKYDKAFSEKVKESMTSAQQELADAISSGDAQKQVAANRKIAALSIEEARLNAAEKMRTETKEQVKTPDDKDYMRHRETPKELPSETPPDPQAQAWAERNDWFGQDRAMTFTAFEIHKDLVEKEGFDPKSQEYYAEIDKRIRVDFPHKFDKGGNINTTKPVQTVASASTSAARSIKPGRKTVKLTPSQVAIAKKLNVPLEDYAKQLSMKEV